MKDIFVDGACAFLQRSTSLAVLEKNMPPPDEYSGDSPSAATIWRYGTMELHFDEGRLWMLWSDDPGTINGGSKIDVDPWFFNDTPRVSIRGATSLLIEDHIDHRVEFSEVRGTRVINAHGNVELFFDAENRFNASAFAWKL